jgi:hypothetical protein
MATGKTVKLKLRHGDREIEVEGSRAEVDELLKSWWTATSVGPATIAVPITKSAQGRSYSKKTKRRSSFDDSESAAVDLHGIRLAWTSDFERRIGICPRLSVAVPLQLSQGFVSFEPFDGPRVGPRCVRVKSMFSNPQHEAGISDG